jgi:uncharacterized protein with HEPN domain
MVDAARHRAMLEHLADAEAMLGELCPRSSRAPATSSGPRGSLASLARFRNLLVHGYAEVDDDRVVEILTDEHLRDLVRFRVDLSDYIARPRGL